MYADFDEDVWDELSYTIEDEEWEGYKGSVSFGYDDKAMVTVKLLNIGVGDSIGADESLEGESKSETNKLSGVGGGIGQESKTNNLSGVEGDIGKVEAKSKKENELNSDCGSVKADEVV